MRGLDKRELALIESPRADYYGCPYGLYAAAERLVKRGVLKWVPCGSGANHEHLDDGPQLALAVRCHRRATERVEV